MRPLVCIVALLALALLPMAQASPQLPSGVNVIAFDAAPPGVILEVVVIARSIDGKWPNKVEVYRSIGGRNVWTHNPMPTPADPKTKPRAKNKRRAQPERTVLIPGPAVVPSPAKLDKLE